MEIMFFFFYLVMFPNLYAHQLLPDTLLLSESLSHLEKCTFIILTSKLDKNSKTKIMDTFYEVEPLKVSIML